MSADNHSADFEIDPEGVCRDRRAPAVQPEPPLVRIPVPQSPNPTIGQIAFGVLLCFGMILILSVCDLLPTPPSNSPSSLPPAASDDLSEKFSFHNQEMIRPRHPNIQDSDVGTVSGDLKLREIESERQPTQSLGVKEDFTRPPVFGWLSAEEERLKSIARFVATTSSWPSWTWDGADLLFTDYTGAVKSINLASKQITDYQTNGFNPVLSPDKKMLGYVERDEYGQSVLVKTLATGAIVKQHLSFNRLKCGDRVDPVFTAWLSWSDDSRHLFYCDRGIRTVIADDVDNGKSVAGKVFARDFFVHDSVGDNAARQGGKFAVAEGFEATRKAWVVSLIEKQSATNARDYAFRGINLGDITRLTHCIDVVRLSPSGKEVAIGYHELDGRQRKSGGFMIYNTETSNVTKLLRGPIEGAEWSRDGDQIAIVVSRGDQERESMQVWVVDIPAGKTCVEILTNSGNTEGILNSKNDGK